MHPCELGFRQETRGLLKVCKWPHRIIAQCVLANLYSLYKVRSYKPTQDLTDDVTQVLSTFCLNSTVVDKWSKNGQEIVKKSAWVPHKCQVSNVYGVLSVESGGSVSGRGCVKTILPPVFLGQY